MIRFAPLCLCALLISQAASSQAALAGENWPEFRGPAGDGHSDSTGLPLTWSEEQNISWKTPIPGLGWSSPVIWGRQIWMGTATADGTELFAVCVDRDSGEILFDGKLFDMPHPQEIHDTNTHASSTPAIEDGRVYLHFGDYGTACLDTATFATLWTRRDFPCNHWRGAGSSPILYGNLLIVHFDGYDYQYVVALDKHTGRTVWKVDRQVDYGTDNPDTMKAYATPQVVEIDGEPQLISPTSKACLAYDPLTGREFWRVRYKSFSTPVRPIFVDGLFFISTGFSKAELYAVRAGGRGDVTDTHVAWTLSKGVPSKSSPLVVDGLVYMIHDDGVAMCVEAESGEIVWQKRVGGAYSASPLYADGRIYLCSHQGVTTVLEPGREFRVLARNSLGNGPDDGFRASPAVAGRALFLRSKTHLYRIENPSSLSVEAQQTPARD